MKINKTENNVPFSARIKIDKSFPKKLGADVCNTLAISRNTSSLSTSGISSSTVVQSKELPWFENKLIDPRKLIINDIKNLKNKIIERHKKIPT